MKKIIVVLLVLSTLLCLFSACKDDPAPTQTEGTPGTSAPRDEELTDNLPEKNMEDFELRILTNPASKFTWAETTLAPEDYTGEEIYDAMFDRNTYISERFNCVITATEQQNATITAALIQTLYMSGDSSTAPHIVMYHDKRVLGSSQYFMDWNDIPYVSIGEEYWMPDVSDIFNINDKQVAMTGSFSLGMVSRTGAVLFNKEMYEDYYGDLSTIYGLVKNNEWTVDKLFELGAGVVENPDDIMDETDQWGISAPPKTLYTFLMTGCEIDFLQKDESGFLSFNLPGDTNAIEKMQKLLKLAQDSDAYYDKLTDVHNTNPADAFDKGHTLFSVQSIFYIPKVREAMEQEFGVMPIPKYNSEQKEYRSLTHAGEMACILGSVKEEDLENIGIIMEALSFDSQQNLIPVYIDKMLKTRYSSDEVSREMMTIVIDSAVTDAGSCAFEDTVTVPIVKEIYMTKKDVIVSTLDGMAYSVYYEILKTVQNAE